METAEKMINKFNRSKKLPLNVTKLAELINDSDATLEDFERAIKVDPVLVTRLMTLVNSSYFGLVRKIDSISRAVALLGMKNLHNIAITDALKGVFSGEPPANTTFSLMNIWAHSAGTAIACKMIAERIFSINGEDAYLCGLLHDIGLIVEYQTAGPRFLRVFDNWDGDHHSLVGLENEALGTNHGEIGYLLIKQWHLSEELAQAIRNHHHAGETLEPESPSGILQLSLYIIDQLGLRAKPNVPEQNRAKLPDPLVPHFRETIEEYTILTEDLPEEIEKARQLYES